MHFFGGKQKENGKSKILALTFVVLGGIANVEAFYSTLSPRSSAPSLYIPKRLLPLRASLSTPTVHTGMGSGDDNDQKPISSQKKSKIAIKKIRKKRPSYGFQQYLKGMAKGFKSKWKLAERMNDQLKRMEMLAYNLTKEDDPSYGSLRPEQLAFVGEHIKPDARCYATVCNAYANSGYGKEAGLRAEEVAARYEKLTGKTANRYITTSVMKSWVKVDMWEKADAWLKLMEDRYAETGDADFAPDCMTYTGYLSGLSTTTALDKETAATRAVDLLNKIRNLYYTGENVAAMPTRFTYSFVMKSAERSCTGLESIDRAEKVFRQLEADYRKTGLSALKPSARIGAGLVHAAAHCGGGIAAAKRAEQFLEEFRRRFQETGDEDYLPNESMYTSLLASYGKVEPDSSERCANKADMVLEEMRENGIVPQKYATTAAINAKVNHRSEESVRQAEDLMRTMDETDSVTYQCLIKAYTRIGLASRADELLKELESKGRPERNTHWDDTVSTVMTMGATLHAWCRDNTTDIDTAIERSEELLQRIDAKYRDGLVEPDEKHVDTWVFENVIRLWSGSRKKDSPDRIEALIAQMESLNKEVPFLFKPNANVYLLSIDAWAKSGRSDGGRKAMATLRKVERLHAKGEMPEPNIRMLSSTLVALTRSSGPRICSMAEGLYRRILEKYKSGDRTGAVNARTLTSLLTMILAVPGYDSAKRALTILRETIDLGRDYINDVAPNTIVFNCMLNGLAKRRDSDAAWALLSEMKDLHAEGYDSAPDTASYSCAVRAIAGDKNSETTNRLNSITSEIFEASERGHLKPDILLFNTILNGYSFTSKYDQTCAMEAKSLLTNLEMSSLSRNPIPPDVESYSAVCRAFAHCKHPDAAREAEEILIRANNLAQDHKINFPGTDFYSYVVLAHAKNGRQESLDKAQAIVAKMQSSYMAGLSHVQPITYTFNMILSACASSGNMQTSSKVFEKLNEALAEGNQRCSPDTNTHNWMILVAGRSHPRDAHESREAIDQALHHFKLLHSNTTSFEPDCSTYEFFLLACFRLLPQGETRSKLVAKAMELARLRGLVSGQACWEAHKSDPNLVLNMFDTTLENKAKGIVVIPSSWCNNVPYKKRSRKVKFGPEKVPAGFSRQGSKLSP